MSAWLALLSGYCHPLGVLLCCLFPYNFDWLFLFGLISILFLFSYNRFLFLFVIILGPLLLDLPTLYPSGLLL